MIRNMISCEQCVTHYLRGLVLLRIAFYSYENMIPGQGGAATVFRLSNSGEPLHSSYRRGMI